MAYMSLSITRTITLTLLLSLLVATLAGTAQPQKCLPKTGATVGFVSPAGPYRGDEAALRKRIDSNFKVAGFQTKWAPHAFAQDGYLAGTDEERAGDLMTMFLDEEVDAIVAVRGGYGCNRVLDLLDYEKIMFNSKIFMGYSDITSCANAIYHHLNITTFHGAVLLDDWSPDSLNMKSFKEFFQAGSLPVTHVAPEGAKTLVDGTAQGTVIGGNLSVFASLVGTRHVPPPAPGQVIILEDVGEVTYRIDRMISTLFNAGYFDRAAAIVFGQCTRCNDQGDQTVEQIWRHYLGLLDSPPPMFMGAQFGHISRQIILPIGGNVSVDATNMTLTINTGVSCRSQ